MVTSRSCSRPLVDWQMQVRMTASDNRKWFREVNPGLKTGRVGLFFPARKISKLTSGTSRSQHGNSFQ